MDGATKIVKGDAIMSIIITTINFIAGVIIGMLQGNMEIGEVFHVYSIATIGDGLVSQLPALLISTATGMIVTRAVSEGSLNKDVTKQFLAQPQALMLAGVLLALFGFVPNTPHLQLFLIAGGLILLSRYSAASMRKSEEAALAAEAQQTAMAEMKAEPPDEADFYKDVNNVYSLLTVEPIEMDFGYSLIPMVDEASGGKLISRIVIFVRRQYAQDMGFVIPSVRLRDSASLGTNQYVIKIKDEEVARGEILVDYYLALEPANPAGEVDGIETIEPAYGIPSKWILPENKEMAEIYGYTVIDPLSVMMTHLSETIKKHTYELLSRAETMQLVETIRETIPELAEEAFPNVISYAGFQKILCNLLKEGIPIKDLGTILECIIESAATTHDSDVITENIRSALKRTITRRFCVDGQLRVITLDAEVERAIIASLTKNEQGVYLALSPDLLQKMIAQLSDCVKKFNEISQPPIILTSHIIRVYLARLIEQFFPSMYVLSFNEIVNTVQIQAIGNITM